MLPPGANSRGRDVKFYLRGLIPGAYFRRDVKIYLRGLIPGAYSEKNQIQCEIIQCT